MTRLPFVAAILVAAVWIATRPADATGCGPAVRPGERVDVADETALIVWDAKTKTQHFVRRATFQSSGYDFGFLVPTPSRPELVASEDDLFKELAQLTAPKTEYRTVVKTPIEGWGCGGGSVTTGADGGRFVPNGGVVVLERKRVGDLDAVVVGFRRGAKDDPKTGAAELAAWLTLNGYAFTPSLEEWLEPYVRDNWVVTAFKIAAETEPNNANSAINLGARPVRMSFKTERPFFPYREPDDQRDEKAKSVPRLLRVFVAAPTRFAGKLGDGAPSWPGKTVWAGEIESPRWDKVFGHAKMPASPAAAGWWLTEFEDRSTPRPGTDEVYFAPSADTTPVYREPTIIDVHHTPWWMYVLCCGWPFAPAILAISIFGIRRLMRRG